MFFRFFFHMLGEYLATDVTGECSSVDCIFNMSPVLILDMLTETSAHRQWLYSQQRITKVLHIWSSVNLCPGARCRGGHLLQLSVEWAECVCIRQMLSECEYCAGYRRCFCISACVSERSAVRITGSWLESLPVVALMPQRWLVLTLAQRHLLSVSTAFCWLQQEQTRIMPIPW